MVYDAADGYTVLFGGAGAGGALGDTWIFKGGHWSQLSPSTSPSPRSGAAMAYDAADGYIVLFGGSGCGGLCGDTWTFKAGQWTERSPSQAPSPRTAPAMTYDAADGYVLLFGGSNGGATVYGDTWTFTAGQWTQQAPSTSPSARGGASLADDQADGYVVMFGGTSDYQCVCGLGDTWKYSAGQWSQLSPSSVPSSRYTYSFAYDPAISAVLFFGGWNANGGCGNNVGDTWEFAGGSWTELSPSLSPSPRQGAAMDYDPNVGGALLFGGTNGTCGVSPTIYSDTWTFGQSIAVPSPTLSIAPPHQLLPLTGEATFTATLSGTPMTNGTLTVSGLPTGVTGGGVSPITPGVPVTLTFEATAAAELGNYTLTFTVTEGTTTLASATALLTVTEITGITNHVSLSQLNVTSSGLAGTHFLPCVGLFAAEVPNCFSVQQNFYVHVPGETGNATYWAQNALLVYKSFLSSSPWVAAQLFEVFSLDSAGNLSLAGCSHQGLIPVGPGCLFSSSYVAQGFGLPATFTLTSTVVNGCIDFGSSLSKSPEVFCPGWLQPPLTGAFIGVGTGGGDQPLGFEPELALVGLDNGQTAQFTGTSGTVDAQVQLPGLAGCATSVALTVLKSGTQPEIATTEGASGLLWTPSGNQATLSPGSSTQAGIAFAPTVQPSDPCVT